MSIRIALNHQTRYAYDRPIGVGPQVIRLRPAVHCRTPIDSYSLRVKPEGHFLNWQQDPHGNFLARCVFTKPVSELAIEVDLVANMTVVNPFDFFLEPQAEQYPFPYPEEAARDLKPYLATESAGPRLQSLLASVDRTPRRTVDFLVDLNRRVHASVEYVVRLEPGVQTPEETLSLGRGSCRDSAWLLTHALRRLGLAARFASGYLIQLKPDVKSLDGPSGAEKDFTDLHAWTEVYLPGAGWIGLDPTSGLFAGEGHIPLACTPQPGAAAPVTGAHEPCDVSFHFEMSIARIREDPRVTKPYTDAEWKRIDEAGRQVDQRLRASDVRLTMGGEPTFVSIDDMEGEEWQTAALGPCKRHLAYNLLVRLSRRFAQGGMLHFGQGKWYPGEPIPRWAMQCLWRTDGEPLWTRPELFAEDEVDYGHNVEDASRFARNLAARLGTDERHAMDAYEDVFYAMWREHRLPANVDLRDPRLDDDAERQRVARMIDRGATQPVGTVLPLQYSWWEPEPKWRSGAWCVRADQLFLLPGDSAMGYRLPLHSLLWDPAGVDAPFFPRDPLAPSTPLRHRANLVHQRLDHDDAWFHNGLSEARLMRREVMATTGRAPDIGSGTSDVGFAPVERNDAPPAYAVAALPFVVDKDYDGPASVVRTALCVEPRGGRLHLFLPPCDRLEVFLDLVAAVEETAAELQLPVVIEGYLPPADPRMQHLKVTPDPGVLEVNVHPADDWNALRDMTAGVYEDAQHARLGTEKFDLDGSHTGSGGGNHVVLGGATPADSPWLRRPDLLKSFLSYWQNHPSLSYLFSGRFIGPTSQAPRADEARADALYELQTACDLIAPGASVPPWLVDRIFRHLLVDLTGNTHRAEFCIDKLFSPDSSTGRLGLVEFRGFEMPPHWQMSMAQQLLLRALTARFWERPYGDRLVNWGTALHDRFLLPFFLWQDFEDVLEETRKAGFDLEADWYRVHLEFRAPFVGEFTQRGVRVQIRRALEPWHVLGEETTGTGTARFVDSSVERLEVRASGLTDLRHVVTVNGRRIPLQPTGVVGEFVAGVRYRAWQPPSCLHPTLPPDSPLTFDLVDLWQGRSLGGCQYHVGHPGGLNPGTFPINAFEAESRRAARFLPFGHTGGSFIIGEAENSREYPFTLDLRRRVP